MPAFTMRSSTLRGGDTLRSGVTGTPRELMTWIAPSGVQTKLDGTDTFYYLVLIGRQGIFAPPQQFVTQPIPLQHGDALQRVLANIATPRLPVLVKASSEAAFIQSMRNLRAQMNPLLGDGTLQYLAYDGTTRQLTCRLLSGLEGDESSGNRGPGWMQVPLIFQADDPFWYDQDATVITKTTFSPFAVTNSGGVEMWPTWVVNGPLTSLTLTNTTTGQSLSLTITLASTDTLTINTTPRIKSITKQDGSNQYSHLVVSSVLWSFPVGTSNVSLTLAGTTGATSIQLSYKQRHLGV